jgi:hypothetical protein
MQNAISIAPKLLRGAIPIAPKPYVQDAISIAPKLYMRSQSHEAQHPALISGFFGGKKNIECSLPTANQQNTSHVNLFRFTNKEMTPMTMSVMVVICPIWLL